MSIRKLGALVADSDQNRRSHRPKVHLGWLSQAANVCLSGGPRPGWPLEIATRRGGDGAGTRSGHGGGGAAAAAVAGGQWPRPDPDPAYL